MTKEELSQPPPSIHYPKDGKYLRASDYPAYDQGPDICMEVLREFNAHKKPQDKQSFMDNRKEWRKELHKLLVKKQREGRLKLHNKQDIELTQVQFDTFW